MHPYHVPIGITGLKEEGKNTVAEVFTQNGWRKGSFALALRVEIFEIVKGWNKPDVYSSPVYRDRYNAALAEWLQFVEENKRNRPSERGGWVRLYLQAHGQMKRETRGESYWLDQLIIDDRTVVDDVRYSNEAERVKQLGGLVLRVRRPGMTSDGTPSEDGVLQIQPDITIVNDGTIAELRDLAGFALHEIRQRGVASYRAKPWILSILRPEEKEIAGAPAD